MKLKKPPRRRALILLCLMGVTILFYCQDKAADRKAISVIEKYNFSEVSIDGAKGTLRIYGNFLKDKSGVLNSDYEFGITINFHNSDEEEMYYFRLRYSFFQWRVVKNAVRFGDRRRFLHDKPPNWENTPKFFREMFGK